VSRENGPVIVEREVDCGLTYQRLRRGLIATLRSLDSRRLGTVVPATAAWSVHDAVAHVVGITSDLNAQRFDVTDPDEWTARQVHERQQATLDDLDVEWQREAVIFEEGLRLMGYDVGSHFVGDLLHHASDIHHALGLARIDDHEALVVASTSTSTPATAISSRRTSAVWAWRRATRPSSGGHLARAAK
jgi:hypothetical protein